MKVNTEELPEMAAAFGVSSIPAVFGLRDAQLIDSFTGVLSEIMIRQFLDGLMPGPAEQAASEAHKLEATDPPAAEARYREALALDENLASARIGLARMLKAQGRSQEALAEIERLARRGFLEPEAETLKAELALQAAGEEAGGVRGSAAGRRGQSPGFEAKSSCWPKPWPPTVSLKKRLRSAWGWSKKTARASARKARRLMLAIFQLMPPDSDLAADFRRRLSFVL